MKELLELATPWVGEKARNRKEEGKGNRVLRGRRKT